MLALSLAASAGAQPSRDFSLERIGPAAGMTPTGDPSAIVAAEIAFAQRARDKGQWTAFRDTADKDAVMFVPGIVNAQAWLKKQKDPARSVKWSPARVYVACDGSYAASTGDYRYPDGSTGTFITLWRLQEKGGYKWVLDWQSDQPASGDDLVEITGKVATCAPGGPGTGGRGPGENRDALRREGKRPKLDIARIPDPPPANYEGASADGSLRWGWSSAAGQKRVLTVSMRGESGYETVIDDHVAAEAP